MHALEFIKQIQTQNTALAPVILIGPGKAQFGLEPYDPLLADRAAQAVVDRYIDPSMRDLSLSVFYADECEPAEVVKEAQTLPFLVERRVIVVRNAARYYQLSADKKSAPLYGLVEYLKSPNPSTLLLFISNKADKRLKFHKACLESGLLVECPQLDARQQRDWVKREAADRQKQIDGQAIDLLLERSGDYLGDIINAVQLAASYVGENPKITAQDVLIACSDVAEDTVWDLNDAIAKSDTEKALQALHQLLQYGKAPDEIMGTLNWMLESAYKACPESTLQNKSAFVTKNVTPLVEKWGHKKIIAALKLSTDTHFMMRSTGVDPKLALELLVIKLAAPIRRTTGRKRPAAAASRS